MENEVPMLDEIQEKIGNRELKVALIGLGYVGLPLAAEFGKYYDTIGFDTKKSRLEELRRGVDSTLEIPEEALGKCTFVRVRDSAEALGLLVSRWYGDPSRKLTLVGVTGTNGKTTTNAILCRAIESEGKKVIIK